VAVDFFGGLNPPKGKVLDCGCHASRPKAESCLNCPAMQRWMFEGGLIRRSALRVSQ
jgi:hypothetical protein